MGMRHVLPIGGFTMDRGKPVVLLYNEDKKEIRIPYYGKDISIDVATKKAGRMSLVSADQALDRVFELLEV